MLNVHVYESGHASTRHAEGQHYYRLVQQKLAELEAASNNKQSTETAILKELLKRLLVDNKEAVLGLLPQKGLDKLAKEDEDWEDSVLLSAAKSLGMPRVHNGCAAMQVYNILRGVRRVVTVRHGDSIQLTLLIGQQW